MALFSTGRKTGVALMSGHGGTTSVPIIDGTVMKHAIRRSDIGGRALDIYLAKLYGLLHAKSGYAPSVSDMQRANRMKVNYSQVAPKGIFPAADPDRSTLVLPDG